MTINHIHRNQKTVRDIITSDNHQYKNLINAIYQNINAYMITGGDLSRLRNI